MRHFISPGANFFFPVLKGTWAMVGGENPFSLLHLADIQLQVGKICANPSTPASCGVMPALLPSHVLLQGAVP